MMTAAETADKIAGFAMRCRKDGEILEIIRDSFGGFDPIAVGESFFALVDRDSRAKAESFFAVLGDQHAAFGWEFNIANERGAVESMHFAGALAEGAGAPDEETFVIVAAQSRNAVSRFYNDLARLNNEQANSLRTALKDLSLQAREQTDRDNHFYDELSRLNNELTTTQRELAKKNAELARLNEQKNQFLGMASHDLRNPLEVILQYSQFLLEDTEGILEAEQTGFIEKIHSSSRFMLNLVNDFLDYSKIDAGRFEVDRSRFNLVELAEKIVAQHQVLARQKRIEIVLGATENIIKIYADETKIEQVLNNLLSNSIKFSPAGNSVKITLATQTGKALITFQDSGAGIAKEEIETLFSPFVKGNARATGGEKSTGLGLAIVKKIVEAHGGGIALESEVGEGTTFIVSLPAEQ